MPFFNEFFTSMIIFPNHLCAKRAVKQSSRKHIKLYPPVISAMEMAVSGHRAGNPLRIPTTYPPP
jgi:hypothetical protein